MATVVTQPTYTVLPLDAASWDEFAELVERNNGVFGGCWCMGYHPEGCWSGLDNRTLKEQRVLSGEAHAALVLDSDGRAQGWCQYGSPDELSRIKHRRIYEKDAPPQPDWRITCFYVDTKHRRSGVARAALEGALDQIAEAGGGLVEAYPQDTGGKKVTASFLYSLTRSHFERAGFSYDRPKGKNHCVMRKTVPRA